MKALEAPSILLDLSSTIVVHGTGQSRATGCEAGLRRKTFQVNIIGHRRQHAVELNNVLRAGGPPPLHLHQHIHTRHGKIKQR